MLILSLVLLGGCKTEEERACYEDIGKIICEEYGQMFVRIDSDISTGSYERLYLCDGEYGRIEHYFVEEDHKLCRGE